MEHNNICPVCKTPTLKQISKNLEYSESKGTYTSYNGSYCKTCGVRTVKNPLETICHNCGIYERVANSFWCIKCAKKIRRGIKCCKCKNKTGILSYQNEAICLDCYNIARRATK